jgi:hypothetical protein
MVVKRIAALMMGSAARGIDPRSSRTVEGNTASAASKIHTEMKETRTAFFLMRWSRSSAAGSAGLCLRKTKKRETMVNSKSSQDQPLARPTPASRSPGTNMDRSTNARKRINRLLIPNVNHAPFCVLFMVVASPAAQNQGGHTLYKVKEDEASYEGQRHHVY